MKIQKTFFFFLGGGVGSRVRGGGGSGDGGGVGGGIGLGGQGGCERRSNFFVKIQKKKWGGGGWVGVGGVR